MSIDENLLVSSVFDEFPQDSANVSALGAAGIELAIAVGAGAALSETPVAIGINLMLLGQLRDVVFAF